MEVTVNTVRSLEYAKNYNWHIVFPDFGADKFFPCHTLNDTFLTFQNNNFDYGPWVFAYPEKTGRGASLALEIYEVDDYRIIKWLQNWSVSILGKDFTVRLIGSKGVARPIHLIRLNSKKEPIMTETLMVIPDGDVSIPHGSEKGQGLSISLTLTVVAS